MAYKDKQKALDYYREYNAKRSNPRKVSARQIAIENGEKYYFTGKPCVHGHFAKRSVISRICMECDRLDKKLFRVENPEKSRESKRLDYMKHQQSNLDKKKIYREANKGKIAFLNAARKKVVKQRTPAWLTSFDKLKMKCLYQMAAMYSRVNGEQYHVDHMIPLQGKNASGLHVPSNLQILRGVENIGKKNKYEVTHA
jgi:hypothetical protein